MKKHPIKTVIHKLPALIEAGEVYLTAPPGGRAVPAGDLLNKDDLLELVDTVRAFPHFAVAPELVGLASDREYRLSMVDLRRAGLLKMPYPIMTVEWVMGTGRYLAVIRDVTQEMNPPPWLEPVTVDGANFYGLVFSAYRDPDGDYLIVPPSILYLGLYDDLDNQGEPWVKMTALSFRPLRETPELIKISKETAQKNTSALFFAATVGALLAGTDGVAADVIETEKINRKRAAVGKPLVPRHTYLRIGRAYRSATSDRSDEYDPRRSPRPHWRRGHFKMVRHGPGRDQLRRVFIRARIVAWHGPGAAPAGPVTPDYVVTDARGPRERPSGAH